ncbi:MAG: calcium-binding protein [Solirubrobacteraceae bacterium]|nr:calcium-binding protein [Solirubrobacteraceae bacterium]
MRVGRRSAAVAVALAIAAGAGMVAPAHAGTVGVETIVSDGRNEQFLVYEARPGERNVVTVRYRSGGRVHLRDSAGLRVLQGCARATRHAANCRVRGTEFGDQFDLGDRDDRLTITGTRAGAAEGPTILDGPGNDVVYGSAGNDSFHIGPGRDRLYGRGGDDVFYSGPGPDTMFGGPGNDTVDYDSPIGPARRVGVRANLDGRANDGAPGERDRIGTDVENLSGTRFADVLIGNARRNVIDGRAGRDRLYGRAGNDLIIGLLGTALIVPGAGVDRVEGGRLVLARDGQRDHISSCGRAVVDRRDVVRGCRTVSRGR